MSIFPVSSCIHPASAGLIMPTLMACTYLDSVLLE